MITLFSRQTTSMCFFLVLLLRLELCFSSFISSSVFLLLLPAATCASYNFSFLSPQGLNFSSQSSAPFWSGTHISLLSFHAPSSYPPAPHPLLFHKKCPCCRPHSLFSVALFSSPRILSWLHSLIKSREEKQFPLQWWNNLSFPMELICLCVAALCHAEHRNDHHPSQLMITTMSSFTFHSCQLLTMWEDWVPVVSFCSVHSSGGQLSGGQV